MRTQPLALLLVAGLMIATSTASTEPVNVACAAISRAVVARMGSGVTVTNCDTPDILGDWTGAVPDSAARIGESSWFTLTGVRITTRVKATVDVKSLHATAVQTLVRGRVIGAADISAENGMLAGAKFERVPAAADLTGARVMRAIEAGRVIQALDVALPFLVKPGEQVLAIVRIGAVEVTASVTAVDGGSVGDEIRVSSKERNRVLRGKIIGPGRVEVLHER